MKRILSLIIAFSLVLSCVPALAETPAQEQKTEIAVYCSPDGNDSAEGTLENPLASLEGARKKVQHIRKSNPDTAVTVYFRGGKYRMSKTVVFDKNDSGTKNAPVTYKAYNDEVPEFTGAIAMTADDFVSTNASEQQRLPEESRSYVSVADLRKLGVKSITHYEGHDVDEGREYVRQMKHVYNEFLYNGKPQTIAQWPNGLDEFSGVARVNSASDLVLDDASKERIYNWMTAENPMLFGWFSYGYTYHRVPVKKFLPDENRVLIEYDIPRNPREGGRYKVANLLEELDVPGEYYLDTHNLKLYYYPPYPDRNAEMELVLTENNFVNMTDTKFVNFENLSFGKTRADVFEMRYCKNISVTGCEFRNVGLMGVDTMYCTDITVDGCDFFYMGSTSVRFDERVQSDEADILVAVDKLSVRTDLTPDNNVVNNCYFYDIARQSVIYTGAVRIHGVGNTMSNNSVHNARSSLVHHGGNDIKIVNNEMWSAAKCVHDMGLIYNGRQLVQRGNEFAYNILHDVTSCNEEAGYAFLIYNDDCLGGVNIHHNILSDGENTVSYSGGPDAKLKYNIFASNAFGGGYWSHGYAEGTWLSAYRSYANQQIPMVYTLKDYDKYDNLKELFFKDRWLAYGNEIEGNLYWKNGTKPTMGDNFLLLGMSLDDQIITSDISYKKYFNDPDNGDYSIKQDIEVPEELKELQKINPDNIGIYISDTRDTVDYKLGEFKAYYPNNYTVDYNSKGAYFAWEQSENADEYIIEFSNSPDFEEVVYSKTCPFNYAYITDLESGKSVYYWRVKAVSKRISNRETRMCSNDVMVFRTNLYDSVDTTLLEKVVADAENQIVKITEGVEPGRVAPGQLEEVKEIIELAKTYFGATIGEQQEIDELALLIQNALADIGRTASIYYDNINDLFGNSSDWMTTHAVKTSIEADEVTLVSDDASTLTALTNTSKPMTFDSVKCFKFKADIPPNAPGSVWQAIGWVPLELAGTKWYTVAGAQGLFIIIKESTIELQIRDGVNSALVLSAPSPFTMGEYSDVQLGCIDYGAGQRWILNVDGKNIFDHISTDRIITKELYFTLHDAPKQGAGLPACGPIGIKPGEAQEPTLYFGDKISFGNMDFASVMGSGSVTASGGAKFSTQPVDNDYTISAHITVAKDGNSGIIFRANTPSSDADTMYKLVFDGGKAVLERHTNGAVQKLSIADNVNPNGKIDINARNTSDGFNITVDINNINIIDCIDESPVTSKGYFGIFSSSPSGITAKAQ